MYHPQLQMHHPLLIVLHLYQKGVPATPKQSSERMAVFLLWNKEAVIQASLFSHSEIPKFLKGNIKFNFKLIIPVHPD